MNKNSLYILVLFLFFISKSNAQVSTYSFNEVISTYTPLTVATSTIAYSTPWDDHVNGAAVQANIGFGIDFDGVTQTQCYISPNGFITFGAQPLSNTYSPLSIATVFTNGGVISALGMDLTSTTDNIYYSTIGSAPNRIFVVQWTNARRKTFPGNFNFQIRLLESSNKIELIYDSCSPTNTAVYNAQVGIRGESNDFSQGNINNRLQTGANVGSLWYTKTTLGDANSSTVRTSLTEFPNNSLKYTYTPSFSCSTPTGTPSSLLIGNSSITDTSFVGNSFTAAIPNPTNYLVLRSTINIPPSSIDVPNRFYTTVGSVISGTYTVVSNSNATSFTQTTLLPNTTYHYWVIPFNSNCLGSPFYNFSNMISSSKATCISAPTGLSNSTINGNSFTASWLPVVGATDYVIDVSTNNTFTGILPAYSNLSTSGQTNIVVSGLNSVTTYYYRVRALGISCNINSSVASVTTICGSYSIPYFQNFDSTPVLTLPTCMSVSDLNLDSNSWQVKNTFSNSSPNSYHLNTNTATNSNDWFFTPGLNLTAGVAYRLKFSYNTKASGIFAENLKIRIGNAQTEANMNITLLDLPNIVNSIYQTAIVDFSIVSTGDYFIGFQGYSFLGQSTILIDDISVIVSPTCFEPTNIVINSIGVTNASISWTASNPIPSNGYEYIISTSNVTPSFSAIPTGSVGAGITSASLSGLSSATLYYVWVRGNCGSSDKSVWSFVQSFTTDCSASTFLTVTNGTLCGGGTTTLQAIGSSGSTIEWFSDSAATALVGTGSSFVTPNLGSTTTFYAQSKTTGGLITTGPISPIIHGGTLGSESSQAYINFSVLGNTNLQSIDVYPINSNENIVVSIRNSSNAEIGNFSFLTNVIGGNTPQSLNLGIDLTSGSYSLFFDTLPPSGLVVNVNGTTYPYNSSIASITGNGFDNSYYLYAYNWKFSNICKSLITPVVATITAAPIISFSETSTIICKGESSNVVTLTGFGAYDTFSWSPTSSGITGDVSSGFTFQPITSTLYAFTAFQSTGNLCSRTIYYTVTVKPEPPAISVIPPSATLCEGEILPLNASLASAPPVTIYEENFNSPTNNWVTTNNSTGGLVANTAWTLRNNLYNYTSPYWNVTFTSNDASQFYFTNSDAAGPPGTNRTITILESPSFSLVGFTTANLNFYHYLRYIGGNTAIIQASINGGSTWTTINSYTGSQGSAPNFVNSTVSMNSLLGNPNVKIRFYYDATWDYGWAIDNVKISGTLALEVTWLPNQDLYSDSAATIPYISGTPTSIVYTKPNSNITYTGTVIGSSGCSTSNTTSLTVVPAVVSGLLSSDQIICGGVASDLNLTGYTGNIIRWEYANDFLFTSGVTTISNSTNSLTSAQIGVITGNKYYRVVLQNGSCPLVYSNVVSISSPVTTWNGTSWSNGIPNSSSKIVFNGNYSSSSTINACSVEVLSGNVVFNSGNSLVVSNEVNVISGTLVFENNSSLVQINSVDGFGVPIVNSGNITYKRDTTPMLKFDYTYWSSPVFPQVLGVLSPLSPLFYEYNPTISNWDYANTSSNMVPAKGYLIRAPNNFSVSGPTSIFTANFFGIPNTGTISIPVLGNSNQYNLIGNPYPSAIDANLFLSDPLNIPSVDGTIYFWTHNTTIIANQYTANDYAIYNFSGGVGTASAAVNSGVNNNLPNGKIAAGQGFFIKGLSNGAATFKNQMRLTGNNNLFFRSNDFNNQSSFNNAEKHRFWLDIFNANGNFKQLLVAYVENATNTFDRGFDGEFIDTGNPISFYVIQDDFKLSIQGRALPFNSTDIIPLGYKSVASGLYSISLSNFDGLFETQDIYLIDNFLNVSHNLKSGDYSFNTESGTFDQRFEVQFVESSLGLNNSLLENNSIIVFKDSNNKIIIKSKIEIQSVEIYDIRGSKLFFEDNINNKDYSSTIGSTNQVLILKIKTIDNITRIKKIIR
jgi:hypothetical protein